MPVFTAISADKKNNKMKTVKNKFGRIKKIITILCHK